MELGELRKKNSHLEIREISDEAFKIYGRVISEFDFTGLIKYMEEKTPVPEEGNVYVASDPEMEAHEVKGTAQKVFYGDMPIEIGYCNGRGSTLNGLEYHKGSEIDIAATDLILLLGRLQDISDNKYDSQKVEAFYVPRGTAVELYGTTLHFAPCRVYEEGFKCVVILPLGTNLPIDKRDRRTGEEALLYARNKWLLAHPSRKILTDNGAYAGIVGENIGIKL